MIWNLHPGSVTWGLISPTHPYSTVTIRDVARYIACLAHPQDLVSEEDIYSALQGISKIVGNHGLSRNVAHSYQPPTDEVGAPEVPDFNEPGQLRCGAASLDQLDTGLVVLEEGHCLAWVALRF